LKQPIFLEKEATMRALMLPHWAILCLYGGGATIAIFLLVQHWMHVPFVLPWLIFLTCPVMHLFVHRGHRHLSHDSDRPPPE
jgi:hypothetical protein